MTVAITLNDMGRMMMRGYGAALIADAIELASPKDAVTAVSIDLTRWLGGATLSSRLVTPRGMTVTDEGVTSSVWALEASRPGETELRATASDGRVWVVWLNSSETQA